MSIPRVYAITPSIPAQEPHLSHLASNMLALLQAGALVQLRQKSWTTRQILGFLEALLPQAPSFCQAQLLLNERCDLALCFPRLGVHLPETGLPPPVARKLIEHPRLLGMSCHDPDRLFVAAEVGADLATFGPIFASPGKGPALKLEQIRQIKFPGRLAVFGLGGIEAANAAACGATELYGLAAIRAIFETASPAKMAWEMEHLFLNAKKGDILSMPQQESNTMVGASKKLLFVCGKGGVGKTTVACAIALRQARQGKRVMLVGIHSTDQVSRIFKIPTVGLRETQLEPRLFAIHLDEQMVFDSFIRKSFKFKTIYRRIIESPVYQYFTAAAPGIKELVVLENIQEFLERTSPAFDQIIVDCPATGHGLSFFDVGHQAIQAFPIGPLRRMGEGVQKLLTDSRKTGVILVTLAEEMPTNEAIELYSAIQQRNIEVSSLVVNALFAREEPSIEIGLLEGALKQATTSSAPGPMEHLLRSSLFYESRSQINQFHLQRLRNNFKLPPIEIPFLVNEAKDIVFLEDVGRFLNSLTASAA